MRSADCRVLNFDRSMSRIESKLRNIMDAAGTFRAAETNYVSRRRGKVLSIKGRPEYEGVLKTTVHVMTTRRIWRSFLACVQAEGAGAAVRRSIGGEKVEHFTPFLMMDHLVSAGDGFPDHPHRGQETITYVLQGNVDHEDFTGSRGTIGPGDLQFMTAGRGIVHAEMPKKDVQGRDPEILQLWIDLPRHLKDCEPRYRDLMAREIPTAYDESHKVTVKVISGEAYGTKSTETLAYTPIVMYDYLIKPGGKIKQPVPSDFNVFLYVLTGSLKTNEQTIPKNHAVLFEENGTNVSIGVNETADENARFILVGGKRLDQPIFQLGPFVETSRERARSAFGDFLNFRNGFERSKNWKSNIGNSN